MRKLMACLAALAATAAANAAPILIDFNGGTPGSSIGSFYAGQGVTFSNGAWHAPISNQSGTPSTGVFLVDVTDNGFNPPFSPTSTTPIVGTFSGLQSTVSILAFDVGGNGVTLKVYDSLVGGTLLGSDTFFGTGGGVGTFVTLSVTASGIRRFALYQPGSGAGDGVGFDNLEFTPQATPEPISLLVFGGLVAGSGWLGRRRMKAAATA